MLYEKTSQDYSWPISGMQPRIIRLRRNVTELEQRLTELEQVVQEDDHLLQLAACCFAAHQLQEEEDARTNGLTYRSSEDSNHYQESDRSPKKKNTGNNLLNNSESFNSKNEKSDSLAENEKIEPIKVSKKEALSPKRSDKKKNIPILNNNNSNKVNNKNIDSSKIQTPAKCKATDIETAKKSPKSKKAHKAKNDAGDRLVSLEEVQIMAKTTKKLVDEDKNIKNIKKGNASTKSTSKNTVSSQKGKENGTQIKTKRKTVAGSTQKDQNRELKKGHKQKTVLSVQVDCEQPALDGIFDVENFRTFLKEKFKVNGKVNNFGSNVTIECKKNKIVITTVDTHFSKRYVKYLSKKYLKKKCLRDLVRVVSGPGSSSGDSSEASSSYLLCYYRVAGGYLTDDESDDDISG